RRRRRRRGADHAALPRGGPGPPGAGRGDGRSGARRRPGHRRAAPAARRAARPVDQPRLRRRQRRLRPPAPGGRLKLVVSGLGNVGAWGAGATALAAQLRERATAPVEVDRRAGYHRARGARTAWLAAGVDLSPLLPAAQARRMSLPGRFALAASRLALDEAGLPARDASLHLRTAVVLGTAYG